MINIKFDDEFHEKILSGEKRSTFRCSHKNLCKGDLFSARIEKEDTTFVVLSVERIRFTDIDTLDAMVDGFDSIKECKEYLLKQYPEIEEETPLYRITFQRI